MKTSVLALTTLCALPLGCSYNRFDHPGEGTTVQGAPGASFNTKVYNTDKRTAQPKVEEHDPAPSKAGGPLAGQFDTTVKCELTDNNHNTQMQGNGFLGGLKFLQYQGNENTAWTKAKWESTGNGGWRWTGPGLKSQSNLNVKAVVPEPASQPQSP